MDGTIMPSVRAVGENKFSRYRIRESLAGSNPLRSANQSTFSAISAETSKNSAHVRAFSSILGP